MARVSIATRSGERCDNRRCSDLTSPTSGWTLFELVSMEKPHADILARTPRHLAVADASRRYTFHISPSRHAYRCGSHTRIEEKA